VAIEEKITVKEITDNPGLISIKLGQAKLEEYSYTLLHYYDMNPIIEELNKLNYKSFNLTETITKHPEYKFEIINYLKILTLTQDRAETKLKEIIPHPQRYKRGLINGIGSIFKAVTGNLDASDGERYENLIRELQLSQNKLTSNIRKENSLSLNLLEKFNNTIETVQHNEKLLESKLNQLGLIVQKTTLRENTAFIKDVLNQVINLYEIIDAILTDIENAITFSKLKILHPSIIKTKDLYFELLNVKKVIDTNRMPLEVTLENTILYEKLIKVESYIFNNKVNFLLKIPITYPEKLNYYHFYSAPIYAQSLFKVILPKSKYLLKNKLHYSYRNTECTKIKDQYYVCDKMELQTLDVNSSCEVQLLEAKSHHLSTCRQVQLELNQPIVNPLDYSSQWLIVLPHMESLQLTCFNQEDHLKLIGTYVAKIPMECQITFGGKTINNLHSTNSQNQIVLFPDIAGDIKLMPKLNLSVHLDDIRLDDLYKLKRGIIDNEPRFVIPDNIKVPSIWTVFIYVSLIIALVYFILKKINLRRKHNPRRQGESIPRESLQDQDIQLPSRTV